ncbi:tetratricopeptide repeat protein [Scopulibacillus darangshiensis]|uniref:Tetratricopeptide repeat protein n=1 Tax=Scopulibacillus darangshiensis TaxID=442528 RepID=A0A4R2NFM9_9BACL|nr:tetratricopeptide repeat protein [Scopulibacillus darangshiensis]TCP19935.1 tetratricopeptide repeat protein [Scopulibacillus darangshiensis]
MLKQAELINPLLVEALGCNNGDAGSPNDYNLSSLRGKTAAKIAANMDSIEKSVEPNIHRLKCLDCGKKGEYDIGEVFINIEDHNINKEDPIDHYLQCTGYFRCKHCNSAGNWEIPNNMLQEVTFALPLLTVNPDFGHYSIGKSQAFDGSMHRYSTDTENHILKKIMTEGQNAYYWNRLGNIYKQGRRPDLAAVAFEQSIRIDNDQLESHYSLGNLLIEIGRLKEARAHFQRVLRTAHTYNELKAESLRDFVSSALQQLFYISDGAESFLSSLPTRENILEEHEGIGIGEGLEIDLELIPDELESFYPLAEVYMGQNAKKLPLKKRMLKYQPMNRSQELRMKQNKKKKRKKERKKRKKK